MWAKSFFLFFLTLQGAAGAAEQSYGILGRPGSLVPVFEMRRDGEVAQVVVALAGGSGKRGSRGLPRDACLPFKPSYAKAMARPFPMIVVDDIRQPAFNPYAAEPDCGPTSAHALYGMRALTYAAIGDWLVDGTVREKVSSR